MKSYNHLWETFIDEETIRCCIVKAAIGKKKRKTVKFALEHTDKCIAKTIKYANNFHNYKHDPVTIKDGSCGKIRSIIVPRFKEQIIHHMVVYTMMPILMKGMYRHSYASVPNRGAHQAKKVIKKWIKHDPKNTKYCLKMDIKKFFDSIDHDVLATKLKKTIHDERFLHVALTILDAKHPGIPLGFYTSQWFANWLLQPLDHYIKEELHVKHYCRYMDDMVIFGSNKRRLHEVRRKISKYLKKELHLKLKENWQVFRFDYVDKNGIHKGRDLDFMGFRFKRDHVILRKSILMKMSRKARKILKKKQYTIHDCRQIMSYKGWIDHTDSYYFYINRIAPNINFDECRGYISSYTKKHSDKVD